MITDSDRRRWFARAGFHCSGCFRSFGEDCHERSLEEKHVFPSLINAGAQHEDRGDRAVLRSGRSRLAHGAATAESGVIGSDG
jgi:hypothetical protein